jgi:fermentation-respiration switch protein FrsA (DUF1100 family)
MRAAAPTFRFAARLGGAAGVVGGVGLLGASWWLGGRLTAPMPAAVGPCPEDFPAEDVEFANERGERVRGWWRPGSPGAGCALLLHPLSYDRRAMLSRARLLAESGIGTLLIDLCGHGESRGQRVTFGFAESADARAAASYARERAPGERLGAIGLSLGGAAALLGPRPIAADALVLEAVYPTLAEAIESRIALRLGRFLAKLLTPLLVAQVKPRLGVSIGALRPIAALRKLRSPILVAAGTADPKTPFAQSLRFYEAAPHPKELWAVEGAGHDDFLAADPGGYRARIGGFLRRHLGRRGHG